MRSLPDSKYFVFKCFLSDLAKHAIEVGPCLKTGSYYGKSAANIRMGGKEIGGI